MSMTVDGKTEAVLDEVRIEREKQDAKWGQQDHPDGCGGSHSLHEAAYARERTQAAVEAGKLAWRHVLREEVAEAFAESDPARLRIELVQVAAVAVAWVEAIDRRDGEPS